MFLVDSHTHLYFPEFENDCEETVQRALDAGVRYFINIGTDVETSKRAIGLAEQFDGMFATVGFHPHDAKEVTPESFSELEKLVSHPKVVAIGEVGLDYCRNLSSEAVQREVLVRFFELAKLKSLPLALHIRDAYEPMLELLKAHFKPPIRAVSHCFSGTAEVMKELLSLGLYISFAGQITYKKNDALREAAKQCSAERILVETDAPFLAPQRYRGKRNEPAFMLETAEFIAALRGTTLEQFAETTSRNAAAFYGISIFP